MAQLTLRAIVNMMDLEPRCGSSLVSAGLLGGLALRLQRVYDMEIAELCVKWCDWGVGQKCAWAPPSSSPLFCPPPTAWSSSPVIVLGMYLNLGA